MKALKKAKKEVGKKGAKVDRSDVPLHTVSILYVGQRLDPHYFQVYAQPGHSSAESDKKTPAVGDTAGILIRTTFRASGAWGLKNARYL